MVNVEAVSNAIGAWFSKLPVSTASIKEDYNPPYEYVYKVDMQPSNPHASSIFIGVRADNTFDIAMGKDITFEEISLSIDLLLTVCEAVSQGYLKEEVLEWRGKVFRSKGILQFLHEIQWQWISPRNEVKKMTSDRWMSNKRNCIGLFGVGYKRLIEYQPWINERVNYVQ